MSVFFRGPAERQWTQDPPILPNSQQGSMLPSFTNLHEREAESALRKVAIFASMNLIAGLTSSLPMDGFTGDGANKRQVGLPPFFTDPDGSGQGLGDWIYQLVYSWAGRGNAIGHILDRDSMGRPSQIVLQHPDRVAMRDENTGPVWTFNGVRVPTEEVWHRRMFPIPGRRLGLSPISLHALTIGQGLAASAFGLRWFQDGGHPSAILTNTDKATVSQETAAGVKAKFLAALRGNREPVVMGAGWSYQAIQIPPNESQFLETQRYSAAECARIFGPGVPEVLGYETGGSYTYKNAQQRAVDLLKFTFDRWLSRVEYVLSTDMLANPRYVKINRSALLATDALARFTVHELALRNQIETVNEVREIEDMAPVPWGSEPNQIAAVASPTPVQPKE